MTGPAERKWLKRFCQDLGETIFESAARRFAGTGAFIVIAHPGILKIQNVRNAKAPKPCSPKRHDREHRRRKENQIELPKSQKSIAPGQQVRERAQSQASQTKSSRETDGQRARANNGCLAGQRLFQQRIADALNAS